MNGFTDIGTIFHDLEEVRDRTREKKVIEQTWIKSSGKSFGCGEVKRIRSSDEICEA